MRICVVTREPLSYSETFIRQRVRDMPAETTLVCGWPPWRSAGSRWETAPPGRAYYRALSLLRPRAYRRRADEAYADIFKRFRADAVLAEYGPTGVAVMGACRRLRLPLFVGFHGFDASRRDALMRFGPEYPEMFRQAAGIFAVSVAMRDSLIAMSAPADRTHYIPSGADCESFAGADPASSPPLVVAVARFVAVKAPQLTLAAFAQALRQYPQARLRMIGDGPLLGECRRLSESLGVDHAVTFLGRQPHHVVAEEMRRARLFAQHSVEDASGAVEGSPVAVMEAGAAGLPVVATRHGGIPEVVIDNETGLLVEERDVTGMARRMLSLLRDPAHAALLGGEARSRICAHFSAARSIERVWAVIKDSGDGAWG